MAIVDVRNVSVLETNFSFKTADFTFFLEEPATAPVTIRYYTQDGSASHGENDYTQETRTLTISAGQTSATATVNLRGDTLVEGNETFQIVAIAGTNAELADGAAALVATATILDNDDSDISGSEGQGTLAERIFGPEPLAGFLPTMDVRGLTAVEGDSGLQIINFLVTLDRPATAEVRATYYLQSNTASSAQSDFGGSVPTLTIPAGQQSAFISASIRGDTNIETDEEFQLVLFNPSNAVLSGNAAALTATARIEDDDGETPPADGEIGGFADQISGPYPEPGILPTLRINDVTEVESAGSSSGITFLVTLDTPAPADVTFAYVYNNGDAGAGDYNGGFRTGIIRAGEQALAISTFTKGDSIIEEDEQFTITLTNVQNAVFEDGAPILEATATILDADSGAITAVSGIGEPGRSIEGPAPGPTLRFEAINTSTIESDRSNESVYVHFILSAPTTAPISFSYETIDQSATAGEDYNQVSKRTATIQEGTQSGFIPLVVRGDNEIEGNESFALRFSDPVGFEFELGGATMDATILIRDNDIGDVVDAELTGPDFDYLTFTPGATQGNDTLTGDENGNQLAARAGDDVVYGGGAGDLIDGGAGEDSLFGEDGNDWITPGDGGGVVHGGAGRDMASFATLSETAGRLNTQYRMTLDLESGIVTTSGDDVYQLTNVERITGTIYADYIRGDAGDNELRGLGDYDWFVVTEGNDTYDGGTGQDMASFLEWFNDDISVAGVFDTGAPLTGANVSGVVVDLADSSNNTNLAAGHTFTNIERITGSGREDVFYGDDGENDFRGLGGYDWFVSSAGGRERYFGGDGIDTVTYFNASAGIEASLSSGTRVRGEETGSGQQGDAARDLYFEIEALVGSNFNDVLRGSSDQDFLSGLNGDDFIYGLGGADNLKGGGGDDRIFGGGGTDTAYFDGNAAEYTFNRISDDTITVASDADGIDRLIDIELLQFADQELSVSDIL